VLVGSVQQPSGSLRSLVSDLDPRKTFDSSRESSVRTLGYSPRALWQSVDVCSNNKWEYHAEFVSVSGAPLAQRRPEVEALTDLPTSVSNSSSVLEVSQESHPIFIRVEDLRSVD
jgi:hypothetical protein